MNSIESNRTAQLEVASQILRLCAETVDSTTVFERELYNAAERLAELVMSEHNARSVQEQGKPGYAPADDPDSGLIRLTVPANLPPWVANPRPNVQIEPYIPAAE